mmetsp:Transcript_4431/g.4974  ORF Transcript_4431/g.4974 Transcript_4431/m.4974 type:complete len:84 (+) Transcript_4431:236-487(+)
MNQSRTRRDQVLCLFFISLGQHQNVVATKMHAAMRGEEEEEVFPFLLDREERMKERIWSSSFYYPDSQDGGDKPINYPHHTYC